MDEADLEAVRTGYRAFSRRADEELLDLVHPDVELNTYADGTFRGRAGLREWIASMDEAWEGWHVAVEEIIDAGPRAIVVATLTGRSRINKITTSLRFWVVWQVIDGQPAIGHHFTDLDSALALARAPLAKPPPTTERISDDSR